MALAERIAANAPLAVRLSRQVMLESRLLDEDAEWARTRAANGASWPPRTSRRAYGPSREASPDLGRTVRSANVTPMMQSVVGTVVRGEQRGRELGFPTANIRIAADAGLEFGVYAGRALGRPAAVSVGVRPTFGDELEPLLEAYIVDFDGDLYGRELTVELVEYLRPELRFDSVEDLVAQMHADVAAVRSLVDAG